MRKAATFPTRQAAADNAVAFSVYMGWGANGRRVETKDIASNRFAARALHDDGKWRYIKWCAPHLAGLVLPWMPNRLYSQPREIEVRREASFLLNMLDGMDAGGMPVVLREQFERQVRPSMARLRALLAPRAGNNPLRTTELPT